MAKTNQDDGLQGLAIASIICSSLSWLVLGIILAPLGVAFGAISLKSSNSSTRTLGICGLVIGVVSLTILVFSFMILAAVR